MHSSTYNHIHTCWQLTFPDGLMDVPEGITLMQTAGGQNSPVRDEDKKKKTLKNSDQPRRRSSKNHKLYLPSCRSRTDEEIWCFREAKIKINRSPNVVTAADWTRIFGAKRSQRSWIKKKKRGLKWEEKLVFFWASVCNRRRPARRKSAQLRNESETGE